MNLAHDIAKDYYDHGVGMQPFFLNMINLTRYRCHHGSTRTDLCNELQELGYLVQGYVYCAIPSDILNHGPIRRLLGEFPTGGHR